MNSGKKRMNIILDEDMRADVELYAKKYGVSMSGFINFCIADFIKQNQAMDLVKLAKQLGLNQENITASE